MQGLTGNPETALDPATLVALILGAELCEFWQWDVPVDKAGGGRLGASAFLCASALGLFHGLTSVEWDCGKPFTSDVNSVLARAAPTADKRPPPSLGAACLSRRRPACWIQNQPKQTKIHGPWLQFEVFLVGNGFRPMYTSPARFELVPTDDCAMESSSLPGAWVRALHSRIHLHARETLAATSRPGQATSEQQFVRFANLHFGVKAVRSSSCVSA